MKTLKLLRSLVIAATFSSLSLPVAALSFGEKEINRHQFAVVAAPYHHGYNLLILEQIPGQRPCWNEIGNSPTVIDPLFLNFDFTNACIRRSDSNGYSIRFKGEDYGLDYLLNIVKRDGELHLVGTPRDSNKPELHIGKTHGFNSGSLKIHLNSQWRLTKRTYGGRSTEHVYLSNSSESRVQADSYGISEPYTNSQQSIPATYQPPQQVGYPTPGYINPGYSMPQPVNNAYPQPMSYPAPGYINPNNTVNPGYSMPQPVNNAYPQQMRYQPPQQVGYPAPGYINPGYSIPQPVNNVYPQQMRYQPPQQVGYPTPGYINPNNTVNPGYSMPQPVNNVYPQQMRYQPPQLTNDETKSLNINYQYEQQ